MNLLKGMYLDRIMVKQKDVVSIEITNEETDRYSKTDYVVVSRDEYSKYTNQFLACKIIYSKEAKLYLIPIHVSGLRRYSKVNTLSIYTLKKNEAGSSQKYIGKIFTNEFLQIA